MDLYESVEIHEQVGISNLVAVARRLIKCDISLTDAFLSNGYSKADWWSKATIARTDVAKVPAEKIKVLLSEFLFLIGVAEGFRSVISVLRLGRITRI